MRVLISFIFIAVIYSQNLLAEGETSNIVSVKQNEIANAEDERNKNNDPVVYTVTVSPLANEIINKKSNANLYKDYTERDGKESNKINCGESPSFGDLIACEGLKTQNSVDSSTENIFLATLVTAITSFLALIAAIFSVFFVWKSLIETRQANIFQLQPWLTIGRPTVSRHTSRIPRSEFGEASFRIEIPVTNEGKTPVKAMRIDVSYIEVQMENTKGDKLLLREHAVTKDRTMPLNPTVKSVQIITCSCNRVIGAKQAPINDFIGDDVHISINIGADVRFTDISTPKGRLKRINFYFDNIHNSKPIDQFRVFDAIEERDSSNFVSSDQ